MLDYLFDKIDWNFIYFNNRIIDYTKSILLLCILFLLVYIIKFLILKFLNKFVKETKNTVDDFVLDIVKSIHVFFLFFISFYVAFLNIVVSHTISHFFLSLAVIIFTWQFLRIFHISILYVTKIKLGNFLNNANIETASGIFSALFKFAVWTLAFLYILSTNGVNVGSLIAGIGVSSIVIAFALKGMLEDLFSSFSIYFDRPFAVGDTVDIGGLVGTVTRVGFKSTRITSYKTGEEIVLANTELLNKEIRNYTRIKKRRVFIKLKVSKLTSVEKIQKIPSLVEDIFLNIENVDYKRTHFRSIEDNCFKFSTLYFLTNKDYTLYLDTHQKILLEIMRVFEKEDIELAHPIQTVLINK